MAIKVEVDVEIDREDDGRFIAEIRSIPGVLVYGATEKEATKHVLALLFRVLADKVLHNGTLSSDIEIVVSKSLAGSDSDS